MRKGKLSAHNLSYRLVGRVVSMEDLPNQWEPQLNFLVKVRRGDDHKKFGRLAESGVTNLVACTDYDLRADQFHGAFIISEAVEELNTGDVVAIEPGRNAFFILYRPSDLHHSVLVTNRCNSFCVMCSQPPTTQEDSWLVTEAVETFRHIKDSPNCVGLTGGEPLLLGSDLRTVINELSLRHPGTRIDVLTNGRLLSNQELAGAVLTGLDAQVSWLVPLYGHADFLHDFVVQSQGAFEETINGLLTLQAYQQAIQIRIVLIPPVLETLPELCRFVSRNLPFVREVALMACEPTGFALANRDLCETDLARWHEPLKEAARALERGGLPFLFMNTPRCALPKNLWPKAHKSISDWKWSYAKECLKCREREVCSGLFSSHERGWLPTEIRAFKEVTP